MSVQSQINRISGAVSDALAALADKGVTVPDGTKVDGLADLISAIEAGGGSAMTVRTGTITLESDTYSAYIPKEAAMSDDGLIPNLMVVRRTDDYRPNQSSEYEYGSTIVEFTDSDMKYPTTGYKNKKAKSSVFGSSILNIWLPRNRTSNNVNQTGIEIFGMAASTVIYSVAGVTLEYYLVWW